MIDATTANTAASEIVFNAIVAFVVFVLTSSSLGLWLAASFMKGRWKAYTVAVTYAMAVIIIVTQTKIPGWLTALSIFIAVLGPIIYSRIWLASQPSGKP